MHFDYKIIIQSKFKINYFQESGIRKITKNIRPNRPNI